MRGWISLGEDKCTTGRSRRNGIFRRQFDEYGSAPACGSRIRIGSQNPRAFDLAQGRLFLRKMRRDEDGATSFVTIRGTDAQGTPLLYGKKGCPILSRFLRKDGHHGPVHNRFATFPKGNRMVSTKYTRRIDSWYPPLRQAQGRLLQKTQGWGSLVRGDP
jgi:hypothetical protein